MGDENVKKLDIRLLTTDSDIAVPNLPLSIPVTINPDGLNKLVHQLLLEDLGDEDYEEKSLKDEVFKFFVLDDLLVDSLDERITEKQFSTETTLEVYYVKGVPAPEPGSNSNHNDWVSGVCGRGKYVLTSCYDNTVNIFNIDNGEKVQSIAYHGQPVKDVVWISLDEKSGSFVSASHDQTLLLYKWNPKTATVEAVNVCKGHEKSVECVAVNPCGNQMASGSFDANLKIWGTKVLTNETPKVAVNDESQSKSRKIEDKIPKTATRTPLITLAGHKESISSVTWMNNNDVVTASLDHTIKIWDIEMSGMKSELIGNRSFFSISYSPLNGNLITASADSAIRLYDPRSQDGVLVKSQYTSHKGWINSVFWSQKNENLFISAGNDNLIKVWDSRSYKTPLFDLKGHTDRALCCNWNVQEFIISGGADNTMKIFNSKN